jgi:hypothetical protein
VGVCVSSTFSLFVSLINPAIAFVYAMPVDDDGEECFPPFFSLEITGNYNTNSVQWSHIPNADVAVFDQSKYCGEL